MLEIIAIILVLLGIAKIYQKLTKETFVHSINWCVLRWLGLRLAYHKATEYDTNVHLSFVTTKVYFLFIGVWPNEGYNYPFGKYKFIRLFKVWEK